MSDEDDPAYNSEDARASRQEDRAWGCGGELIGCGFDAFVIAALVPLAFGCSK